MSRVATTPAAPVAPRRPDEYSPDPARWMALGILLAAGFMTLLDVSIVNVALPRIERGLHAQENALQWIVAGYALALGLVLASSHGNFAPAFRMGIVSIAAVVFAALVLVLTDAFTREQRRHVGKPKERA